MYFGSLMAQMVKNLPAVWETWVWSLGQEDALGKGMATHSHSRILAWGIRWTEEPGRLQPMGSQKVGHDLVNKQQQISPYRLVGSSHIQRTQTRAWLTACPINTGGWSDDSLLRRTLLPTSFTEKAHFLPLTSFLDYFRQHRCQLTAAKRMCATISDSLPHLR